MALKKRREAMIAVIARRLGYESEASFSWCSNGRSGLLRMPVIGANRKADGMRGRDC
jgi:hypothetical protein